MSSVRTRLPIAVSAGLAGVALLAACSSSSSPSADKTASGGTGGGAQVTTTAPAAAGGGAGATSSAATTGKTITATLTEFHIALSTSKLTPGTYTFKVKNAGSITHALTVDGKGVDDKSTDDLGPGQSANLTVTLGTGKYEVYCPVGDHKMEGMDTFVQVG